MSSVDALTDTITLVKAAVETALAPLVLGLQGGAGAVRLYYQRALPGAPLPLVVHQSQDSGGTPDDYLNLRGWEGLWTLKAFADNPDTADTWLAGIVSGMASLASPSGYTLTAVHERPLTIPPIENVWQAAHMYRVRLTRVP